MNLPPLPEPFEALAVAFEDTLRSGEVGPNIMTRAFRRALHDAIAYQPTTTEPPEKWRIEAVHARGCAHYTNEFACDCGLLEAARATFLAPSGDVAPLIKRLLKARESLVEHAVTIKEWDGSLYLEAAEALVRGGWRCYWCNALFTDREKAEIHFGRAHSGQTAPECYRRMERKVRDLESKLNSPITGEFIKGVMVEVPHQRERWGSVHDAGKAPSDWFWLLGYLSGKALRAHIDGDLEKAMHHTISSAAVLANWHAALLGTDNTMRPGIDPNG